MEEDYSYLLLKNETPIKSQEEDKKKESKISVNKKIEEKNFNNTTVAFNNTTVSFTKKAIKLKIII